MLKKVFKGIEPESNDSNPINSIQIHEKKILNKIYRLTYI